MTGLPSIRQRLSRALLITSITWSLIVSVVVWLSVQRAVDELLDNTLQESAEILYGMLSLNETQLPLTHGGSLPAPSHDEHLVWQIVNAQQGVLLRSHRAPAQPMVDHRQSGLSSVGDAWRVFGMALPQDGRMLYVAQVAHVRHQARLEAASVATGAALLAGLLCVAWLRSRVSKEVEPILAMSASVAHFDPLQRDARLAHASRAELVPMHDAITDLGARLANRLANERAFSAHAAHALRTPLAGMLAQLAVAQRKSTPEALPHLSRMRHGLDRLRRVVSALLTLFRADNDELQRELVDLASLCSHLPFEHLLISADGCDPVRGDPDLLSAALINLLDNSQRHGAQHAVVYTCTEQDGQHIVVQDDGSGISPARQLQLQAALDARQYEGHMGLGLMLADLIARAHGGRLLISNSTQGCRVEIVIASCQPGVT
jgi:signal transduction histidine kinase